MLSWSGHEHGAEIDLDALGLGQAGGLLPLEAALYRFASAAVGNEHSLLIQARAELVGAVRRDGAHSDDASGEAVMIDAAAVVANFEMMTRLADGTGARFPAVVVADRTQISRALGVDGVVSRR